MLNLVGVFFMGSGWERLNWIPKKQTLMTFSLKVQYIFVIVTTSILRFLSSCGTTHCKFKNSLWQGISRFGVTDYSGVKKECDLVAQNAKNSLIWLVHKASLLKSHWFKEPRSLAKINFLKILPSFGDDFYMKIYQKISDFSQSHDSFCLWKSPRKQKWEHFYVQCICKAKFIKN